jgi:hypothetical protein
MAQWEETGLVRLGGSSAARWRHAWHVKARQRGIEDVMTEIPSLVLVINDTKLLMPLCQVV